MSGVKEVPITITQRQWEDVQNRLRLAVQQSAAHKQDLEIERDRAKQREQELEERSKKEIEALNQQLATAIGDYDRKLEAQVAELEGEMGNRVDVAIAEVRTEFNDAIRDIQSQLDKDKLSAKEQATFWLTQFQNWCNGILADRKHYDHLHHGQMTTFLNQIDVARNMINNGDFGASGFIVSQLANLTQFHHDLDRYESSWLQEFNDIKERATNLAGNIKDAFEAHYDVDGEIFAANIDYWTRDGLTRLDGDVQREILEEINRGDALSLEDIQRLNARIDVYNTAFEHLLNDAERGFQESDIRAMTAQTLAETLESMGWICREAFFENGKEKGDVQALFENPTGTDQIVLTIGNERVEIDQFLQTRNEFVMQQHGNQIRDVLSLNGQCKPNEQVRSKPGYENIGTGRRGKLDAFN